ncbi:hypothetical protein, partial [Shigella boydii]|uniref:hypothetical protein n=1 Tax=Shigella boydii TaxID=621 RepID=UPI002095A972
DRTNITVGYPQTNRKIDTGKTLTRWPVFVDHFKQPESLAEDPETLSISCEVTFRHGTLRFNGNVSEKLLTLLIQELKR